MAARRDDGLEPVRALARGREQLSPAELAEDLGEDDRAAFGVDPHPRREVVDDPADFRLVVVV